ncbi:hypothetical protein HYH03_008570 [Edaphochlamys debaryana]|uniref:Protein kinase domain-containing protein n=1 Tax=Edaphochlamys debaryana TaxID=47281 RepID=A0A835Y2Y4_9CHLO|nr:hypothetical protein HYH03_008570 [Edaphochlamys debaryana]|eukprot:KAG2493146.1 hypothetical protein HYH03_008570 [Edaphochlamys debaryana]
MGDVMGSMAAAAARPLAGEGGSPPGLGLCSQAPTMGGGTAGLLGLPSFDPLWQAAAVPLRQTFGTAAASCSTATSARPSATTRHDGHRPGRASAAKGSLTSDLFGLQPPVARGPSVMDDPADPHAIDTSPPAVIGSASHLVALPEPRPPAAASSHYSEDGGEDVGPTAAGAISSTDSNVRRMAFARLTVFSSPLSLLADVSGLCRAASPDAPDGSIWQGTWCGRHIAIRLASVAPPGAGGGGGAPADWEHRPTGSTFHLSSGSGGLPSGLTNKSAEFLPHHGSGQLRTSPAAGVMSGGALPSGAGGGGGAGFHAHSGAAGISSVIHGLGLGPANAAFHAGLTLEGGSRPNSLASFGLGGCAGPSLEVAVRASRIQHPNLAVVYDIRTAGIDARSWQELYPPPGAGGGGGSSLGRVGSPSVGVMGPTSSSGVVTSLAAVQALRSVRGLAVGGSVIVTLMEICELGHLGTVACRRPSPFQECDGSHEAMGWSVRVAQRSLLRTAREIASGLRALHAAGLAHGSLRPSNVLLAAARADRRGFVARLADAGSASLAATVVNKMSLRASTLVMVAPEALSDTSALHTPAADVYAFGMLLYLMAAGEMPFQGQHLVPVLMAVASGTLAPDWPMGQHDHLAPLFARCIAHNPHHRPTADEILAEIIMHEDHLKDAKRHLTSGQRLPMSGQLAAAPSAATVQPSGLGSAEPSIGCVVAAAALQEPSLGPMIRSFTSTPRFMAAGAGGAQ